MANKTELVDWLYKALKDLDGSASIPEVCKYVWEHHEAELRNSGNLFYTWQDDIRWAAYQLRTSGKMKPDALSPKGIWQLA